MSLSVTPRVAPAPQYLPSQPIGTPQAHLTIKESKTAKAIKNKGKTGPNFKPSTFSRSANFDMGSSDGTDSAASSHEVEGLIGGEVV